MIPKDPSRWEVMQSLYRLQLCIKDKLNTLPDECESRNISKRDMKIVKSLLEWFDALIDNERLYYLKEKETNESN